VHNRLRYAANENQWRHLDKNDEGRAKSASGVGGGWEWNELNACFSMTETLDGHSAAAATSLILSYYGLLHSKRHAREISFRPIKAAITRCF